MMEQFFYYLFDLMFRVQSGSDAPSWMPIAGTPHARRIDSVFTYINAVSFFFFALITILTIVFVIKYRQKSPGEKPPKSPSHSTTIEIIWTVIPTIIVIIMFVDGFTAYMASVVPPENSYQIKVVGRKWSWGFEYPNGYIDKDLYVPIDTDIKILMTSEDVLHSLYVPAFRVKRDAIPGRYTVITFNADKESPKEGYDLFCAEYCGTEHSMMMARVHVLPKDQFDAWLAEASDYVNNLGPLKAGEKLYLERGCKSCHSLDGSAGTGPSLAELYGKPHPLADGTEVVPDENYIRESILYPKAKIYSGYQPVMPTYKGSLTDPEIDALITFIKAQSSASRAEAEQAQAAFDAAKSKEAQ